jgi:hypothetical protein
MPVLISIVVLSFVAGLLVRRPAIVYLFTGVLAVLANVAFVWAIADGKGDDDPAWIILLSLAGAAAAFGAARAAIATRRRLGRAGVTAATR